MSLFPSPIYQAVQETDFHLYQNKDPCDADGIRVVFVRPEVRNTVDNGLWSASTYTITSDVVQFWKAAFNQLSGHPARPDEIPKPLNIGLL